MIRLLGLETGCGLRQQHAHLFIARCAEIGKPETD
jgi:hypothetical protein